MDSYDRSIVVSKAVEAALAILFVAVIGLIAFVKRPNDRAMAEIRTSVSRCIQAEDRVVACAMRVHQLEQEVDMLRLRVEELEERE